MAAYGRVTLNRGGRNSRFDCTPNLSILKHGIIISRACD